MHDLLPLLAYAAAFGLIALAARDFGHWFARARLPLISGFLFCGLLAGPHVLGLVSEQAVEQLVFVDQLAIAFIAFAAGNELYLRELRGRVRGMLWLTVALMSTTFLLGGLTIWALRGWMPWADAAPAVGAAAAILGAAIMVARSPSSAIAVIKELRARGPFTRGMLGVTVILDVAVIVLFTVGADFADALLSGFGVRAAALGLLAMELALAAAAGWLVGRILCWILGSPMGRFLQSGMVLATGYGVYVGSHEVRALAHEVFHHELLVEPLLVCMIAGLVVSNTSPHRRALLSVVERTGPFVFVVFFTLTGASLALDVLASAWRVALALFGVRLVALGLGAAGGTWLARSPRGSWRLEWMASVTQAGVGLGLAKEVALEFPALGDDFATVIIAVIVLNQLVGPPLLKRALRQAGEAHDRAATPAFDGVRDALVFGQESQALALAHQLLAHDWNVKVAVPAGVALEEPSTEGIELHRFDRLDRALLERLDAPRAEGIVAMLDDDEDNFAICQLAYEQYGTDNLVVRLADSANARRFLELGALVVDPRTAIVSLLDHFVRSPEGTSMLLGLEPGRDVVELQVTNPALDGIRLADVRLPEDVLLLSIRRGEDRLLVTGQTRLRLRDHVTVVGATASIDRLMLQFES